MAMTGSSKAQINMTPMIDILLVLIIIFMVITPVKSRGLDTLVPQPSTAGPLPAPPASEIVITVSAGGLMLNSEPMDLETLRARLAGLFRRGAANVVFVRGDKHLEFHRVADVIDLARGAGVSRIALMTN